jgi:four helix bundle protein
MDNSRKYDIHERCLKFAIKTARFVDSLPKKQSMFEYGKQLIRASASIGANLQEADGSLSKKDFINKVGIARKEAKETWYWLRLIKGASDLGLSEITNELNWLTSESEELKLILSSIITKSRSSG